MVKLIKVSLMLLMNQKLLPLYKDSDVWMEMVLATPLMVCMLYQT